ncbi:LysR family transcriptional regulator [Ruegeria arenilitoris]|uniref:LysR family transcriptional regulator n=1 Tax=Ruegeria arenilitoris TaxID=1173585 RepID=UPI00147BFCEF|nr:LysR family transcriptional regulator [Ruegeria arenilitoris]
MVADIGTIGVPALISFHTVARLGGISVAADHLNMAKSGVSRHISRLENHFGVKLVERSGRSVKLTPTGVRLNQRVQSILADIDLLGDIAREESGEVSGQVNFAATAEFGSVIASVILPAVQERFPDLTLVMRPAYEFEDMQDPNTDLAFRIGTFEDDRLVAKQLGSFRCWLVASPELAAQTAINTPDDLKDQPCLTFRGDVANTTWTFFSPDDVSTIKVGGPFATRSFSVLLDLAMAGRGYAFLPEFMLDEVLQQGRLVRCLPKHVSRPYSVYLTFRPGSRRIARVGAVASLAEELVPKLLSGSSI